VLVNHFLNLIGGTYTSKYRAKYRVRHDARHGFRQRTGQSSGQCIGLMLALLLVLIVPMLGCTSAAKQAKSESSSENHARVAPIVAPIASGTNGLQPATTETAANTQSGAAPRRSQDAVYNLPIPAEPKGQLRIESDGIMELRNGSATDVLPVLHLRFTVKNDSSSLDWGVDARLQQLRIAGIDPLRPAFARARGQSLPFIKIPKGQTQIVDLYFALPADHRNASDLQNYTIDWELTAGDRLVSQATTFASIARENGPATIIPSRVQAGKDADSTSGTTSSSMGDITSHDWWVDPYSRLPDPWRELAQ
jgi:hypothetical protein